MRFSRVHAVVLVALAIPALVMLSSCGSGGTPPLNVGQWKGNDVSLNMRSDGRIDVPNELACHGNWEKGTAVHEFSVVISCPTDQTRVRGKFLVDPGGKTARLEGTADDEKFKEEFEREDPNLRTSKPAESNPAVASNRAVQSNLRNGLTNAKAIFTDSEDYQEATPAALEAAEPSLTFQTGASSGPKEISVSTPSANLVVMAAKSKSGTCFMIRDDTTGPGTQFNTGSCDAAKARSTGWKDSW